MYRNYRTFNVTISIGESESGEVESETKVLVADGGGEITYDVRISAIFVTNMENCALYYILPITYMSTA